MDALLASPTLRFRSGMTTGVTPFPLSPKTVDIAARDVYEIGTPGVSVEKPSACMTCGAPLEQAAGAAGRLGGGRWCSYRGRPLVSLPSWHTTMSIGCHRHEWEPTSAPASSGWHRPHDVSFTTGNVGLISAQFPQHPQTPGAAVHQARPRRRPGWVAACS